RSFQTENLPAEASVGCPRMRSSGFPVPKKGEYFCFRKRLDNRVLCAYNKKKPTQNVDVEELKWSGW
ncbi:MAG: hypothetical protein PHI56_05430, partial [Victivallaceae bacterium]|nr:hypothetical protein [Victivallaceae bacterium]